MVGRVESRVHLSICVSGKVTRRNFMRNCEALATYLAHTPLVWTLSRLIAWVQDTGIPSL